MRALGVADRLYREERLTVRKRRARRTGCRSWCQPNARWSLDVVHDQFANGRRFASLTSSQAYLAERNIALVRQRQVIAS